jgi:betaine lipid synthase
MEQLPILRAQLVSWIQTQDVHSTIRIAALLVFTLVLCAFYFSSIRKASWENSGLSSYLKFAYSCFIKPHHTTLDGGQQSALEGFYSTQVCILTLRNTLADNPQAAVYDATRKRLLLGREDLLGLIAAQLQRKQDATSADLKLRKPIWVDVGGGTGCVEEQAYFTEEINQSLATTSST